MASKNLELQSRRDAAFARGLGNQLPVYVERARNAEIWDVEGRRYIDFCSGIAVLNTGHLHPKVQAAVARQLEAFSHTCLMITPYGVAVELAEKLNRLAPGRTPKKAIFVTTGAEAIENTVKIARAYTGRSGVIAFGGGFHGRTYMAMALTGKVAPYKAGFGPFAPEVYHAPFPIAYHGVSVEQSLAALEHIFKYDLEPARVAAIVVEPVLGEGGFYVAPPEFLQALRGLSDQHGIVLVVDEIQTGFGRTGRMFAVEHAGIEPDLMTMAKSLAGGFPLAAVVGKAQIMDAPAPGGLGGTYAGSPIACAAALAVLEVIEEERLCERAVGLGALITDTLRTAQAEMPAVIGEVRGLGAMVAMELVKNGDPQQPDVELTRALVKGAAARGVVLLSCGLYGNVIRFLAPLTAEEAIVREGLAHVVDALRELAGAERARGRSASAKA
jgi:4-aminobutyrate aminotransferase / (S)-3-amino-2-methylpropionate transaminase / 5-aminovalerate transaminase